MFALQSTEERSRAGHHILDTVAASLLSYCSWFKNLGILYAGMSYS